MGKWNFDHVGLQNIGDRISTARLTPRTNLFNHSTTLNARILIEFKRIELN